MENTIIKFLVETGPDAIFLPILDNSKFTIAFLSSLFVGLSKITPWEWDTKLVKAIFGPFLNLFKREKE